MRHEVDQDFVEQVDMGGPQMRGIRDEEIGDAARSLGTALGIAIPDDLVEFGNQWGRYGPPSRPTRTRRSRPRGEPLSPAYPAAFSEALGASPVWAQSRAEVVKE